jgi:exodeoxyribonuclease VII small subunit
MNHENNSPDTHNPNFEESLKRLQEIVKTLENGDTTLDESMALFQEGTSLVKFCSEYIKNAEQKVTEIKKGEFGEPKEVPFEVDQ